MAAWTRSSSCDSASCVEVFVDGDRVVVRDGKEGDDSLILQFRLADWRALIGALKSGAGHSRISELALNGGVEISDRGFDCLCFTSSEWDAFVAGVKRGEFDPERLSSPAPTGVGDAGRTAGMGSEGSPSGHATTGAGGPAVPSAPVAAPEPVTAVQGADSRPPVVATGAGAEDPCVPAPVAALTNLERAHAIVLAQFRLGGLSGEIAEGIVGDLFAAGLIVDDPVVDVDELLRRGAAPLVPVDEGVQP